MCGGCGVVKDVVAGSDVAWPPSMIQSSAHAKFAVSAADKSSIRPPATFRTRRFEKNAYLVLPLLTCEDDS